MDIRRESTDRFVRWAALVGFPELCRSVGLDPGRLLADVGLHLAEPLDHDTWIPAPPVALVLERAAVASGCDDFAVRLNRWRRFSHLGPISLVLREEPDLRSALDLLIRYQRAYNGVIDLRLVETGDLATVHIRVDYGRPVPVRQPLDLTAASLMTTIRGLVSAAWEPRVVCFSHPAPADLTAFHRVFGSTLRFDHEFTGVVFSARDLDAATVTADPGFRPYARQLLQSLAAPRPVTVADEVGSLVEFLLPLGSCSLARVSRDLGVQPRTLHRRLAAEGQSFSAIVQATRVRLATHYLANERFTLTEVSGMLGFATPSAFSTWFRQHFGTSASDWRSRTRVPPAHDSATRVEAGRGG
ncbi:AraC family transcriptional regulator [Blastococcus litoris]|uniref:AraC family transcriptional regulator n=1 Tax=Blastococcus litoris TaxID=2171622 RepID=UPI000E30629D|nr:AraC family transcriptional regulator [Blastococcus litoris]